MNKHILQIHYDEASRRMLDPGFTPLEIVGNPRADWREYWGIRNYFRDSSLDENDYYGFLSPLFFDKTGLRAQQVRAFMDSKPGADVYTFSPSMSDASAYLSVFEQGARRHPGIVQVTQALMADIGLDVDLQSLVNDFRTTAYCNYIIARPVFWDKWYAINEHMFELAEANATPLAHKLNEVTDYGKSTVQMKVFIMERVGSLVMALMPELKVVNLDIAAMRFGDPLFYPCRDEMVMLDALKSTYLQSGDQAYLDRFWVLRHDLLRRCDPDYSLDRPKSFF